MKAEIISIGTELLMGELVDTNASTIASRLPPLGIELRWVTQVGDNLDMLAEAFARGLGRSDIIFTSGGLGPTQDDLTREAIAKALGEEMTLKDDLLEHLRKIFQDRGNEMPATNAKQATLIPSATSIPNRTGTAPGWWVETKGKIIVSMPGPPVELQGIWEAEIAPRLQQLPRGEVILTRNIKTSGLSEGRMDEMIDQYLGQENPYLGIYAKADGIHLRIIAKGPNEGAARSLIEPVEQGLVSLVGPYIWGYDDDTPEASAALLLTQKKLTLGTLETCTGGCLASSITEVPASSTFYRGGMVFHNVESAVAAGVSSVIFDKHGLASQEAAVAMAGAAQEYLKADVGIGVTGVGGPEESFQAPAIEEVPVGMVHIGIALNGTVSHFSTRLPPRRTTIRRRASSTALVELRKLLSSLPD